MSDEQFLGITRYYAHSLAERVQTAETALLRWRAPGRPEHPGLEDEPVNWRVLTCALNTFLGFAVLCGAAGVQRAIFIVAPFVLMLNVQYFVLGRTRQPSLTLAGACGVGASLFVSFALRVPGLVETTRATVACVGLTLLYRALDWVSREGRYLLKTEKLD